MKNFFDKLIQTSSSLRSEFHRALGEKVVIFTSLRNAEIPRLTRKLFILG